MNGKVVLFDPLFEASSGGPIWPKGSRTPPEGLQKGAQKWSPATLRFWDLQKATRSQAHRLKNPVFMVFEGFWTPSNLGFQDLDPILSGPDHALHSTWGHMAPLCRILCIEHIIPTTPYTTIQGVDPIEYLLHNIAHNMLHITVGVRDIMHTKRYVVAHSIS